MKKAVLILVGLVLVIGTMAYASKPNVYQKTISTTTTASSVITFPYEVQDLIIRNDDANYPVWVGINRSTVTGWNVNVGSTEAIWLPAGGEIDLYDLRCTYLAISKDDAAASRVTVIATY